MNTISYPAVFKYDEKEQVFNVSFPDLEGCLTYGKAFCEAYENAGNALYLYLKSLKERGIPLPKASTVDILQEGYDVFPVDICELDFGDLQ